jgi:hypothetical protein
MEYFTYIFILLFYITTNRQSFQYQLQMSSQQESVSVPAPSGTLQELARVNRALYADPNAYIPVNVQGYFLSVPGRTVPINHNGGTTTRFGRSTVHPQS